MKHLSTYIRASLALVGVALGLIVTAGAASAADVSDLTVSGFGRGCGDVAVPGAAPGARITVSVTCTASVGGTTEVVATGVEPEAIEVVQATSQEVDAPTIGDALTVERPAPGRDPALELGAAEPQPAATPAPRPVAAAPVAVIDSGAVSLERPQAPRAAPAPSSTRPTQVLGARFERSDTGEVLARTGIDSIDLTLVAIGLVTVGIVMVRRSSPHRTR